LIVDYLQLLCSDSAQARANRQVEIAEISRGLKGLAKELDIPVIVLAQLNRRVEEGKAEPALHHLRESGAIEQDADVVLLLHRPDSPEESSPTEIPYSLHVAKQRNGPTDKIAIRFNALYTRFEDPVRHNG
ncbi:MAG: DnaB-like helicase C-terminal domain-containing protein, partial [Methylacidiphilaceae bacterium]|nr:DnaB-like helicase C-terminal domain-containing protein [Candidatus Methylacidiphilaceae bacterium]